jgi:hypothetical protein
VICGIPWGNAGLYFNKTLYLPSGQNEPLPDEEGSGGHIFYLFMLVNRSFHSHYLPKSLLSVRKSTIRRRRRRRVDAPLLACTKLTFSSRESTTRSAHVVSSAPPPPAAAAAADVVFAVTKVEARAERAPGARQYHRPGVVVRVGGATARAVPAAAIFFTCLCLLTEASIPIICQRVFCQSESRQYDVDDEDESTRPCSRVRS